MQELPDHQNTSEAQVKATKKPDCWSTFERFNVDTNRTQKQRHRWRHQKGEGNTGPNQGVQTHTICETKNLKWNRVNELKGKALTGKEDNERN